MTEEAPMTPERQDIIDRMKELREKRVAAQKVLDHIDLDKKHIQLDCKHPARRYYTVMGDSSSSCKDCGYAFY